MPNLTIFVTDAQAARTKAALSARYVGTSLAVASLADQARDFILVNIRELVLQYEKAQAAKLAEGGVAEF